MIQEKPKLDEDSFQQFSYLVFSQVHFMPTYVIKTDSKQKAILLVKDIDIKDAPYVALSLQLNLTLLTRDVPLYKGLRKKGFQKVQLFDSFLRNA